MKKNNYLSLLLLSACSISNAGNVCSGALYKQVSVALDDQFKIERKKSEPLTPAERNREIEKRSYSVLTFDLGQEGKVIVHGPEGRITVVGENGQTKSTFKLMGDNSRAINATTFFKISPNKKYLIIGGVDERCFVINTETSKIEGPFKIGPVGIDHIHFVTENSFIAINFISGSYKGISKINLLETSKEKPTIFNLNEYIRRTYSKTVDLYGRRKLVDGDRGVYSGSSYAIDNQGNLLIASHVWEDRRPVITVINPKTFDVVGENSMSDLPGFRNLLSDASGNIYFVSNSKGAEGLDVITIYDSHKRVIKTISLPKDNELLAVSHYGPQMRIVDGKLHLILTVRQPDDSRARDLMIEVARSSGLPFISLGRPAETNEFVIDLK